MSTAQTYRATATRDGRFWLIQVHGFPFEYTQAETLAEIEPMARDPVAVLLEVEPDSFDLAVDFDVAEDDEAALSAARDELAASTARVKASTEWFLERSRQREASQGDRETAARRRARAEFEDVDLSEFAELLGDDQPE